MIEALYNQYFHDVFLYLKAISHSDDIAEELTQETFFKAMKMTDSFRGECDIRVWLCQIAKNCYFSFCRKHKHENDAELTEDIPDDSASSFSLTLEDKETAMEIHKILHTMEEPYKEVFTLRVFGELRFRQIAQLFGKNENWAAVTFHRAKMKILNELEELS
ncbi:MAG: RNA polymerase sigma factor [Oscillospiraceae bacterium]|nr:RNA polymerase sigma factor [Oscillospiraceae bacterium]